MKIEKTRNQPFFSTILNHLNVFVGLYNFAIHSMAVYDPNATFIYFYLFILGRYLSCVSQTMKTLQPFGDVPKKLTEQLRRSFVATRTFSQALMKGKQIVNKIVKVRV